MSQSNLFESQENREFNNLDNRTVAYNPQEIKIGEVVETRIMQSERPIRNDAAPKRNQPAARQPINRQPSNNSKVVAYNKPVSKGNPSNPKPNMNAASSSNGGNGGGKKPPAQKATSTGGGNGGGGKKGKKPKKKSVAKMIFINIVKAVFVLGCLAVMAGAIAAVPLMQWIVTETQMDDINLLDLNSKKISQTSFIYYRNDAGELVELQQVYGADTNRVWVGLENIPKSLQYAAIATEDRDFMTHHGFSPIRTARAAFNQIFKTGPVYGASTIDQQLVKNLTGEDETEGTDGIKRKLLEIYRAWTLEKNYSKDTIMEAYLNTIPLSGTLVGVQTGAQQYFNKEPKDLTIAESAMIIGITNAPGRYNPYVNPDNCLKRRNDVIYFMHRDGYITDAEYEEAVNSPLGLYEGEREDTTSSQNYVMNSYFVDTLYEEVRKGLVKNGIAANMEEAHYLYYNGGLRIVATIDPEIQTAMEEMYEKGYGNQADGYIFPELTAPKVKLVDGQWVEVEGEVEYTQSAMVVLDYDGALKGVVGGIGEKEGDLVLNRAVDSVRQVGSTMKVLAAYPLGIDSGVITYSSMLQDSPSQFRSGTAKYDPTTGLPLYDWPTNYGNSVSNSMMSVQTAVAKSTNTIAVRVGERVGIDNMYDFLTSTLNITSLEGEGATNDRGYSSLVLGGMTHGISPYQMAGAAEMLGNDGVFTPPHSYEEVLDANGNVLFRFNSASTQAIQPGSSYIMRQLMSGVLSTGGTAAGMKPNNVNEAVAKTGTTGVSGSETDRWFLGMTPDYVSVVWWGYDNNQNISWNAGARTNPPAMAWKTLMETIYEGKTEQNSFPQPTDDLVTEMYCAETGYIATPNCPDQRKGYYLPDYLPDTCYLHDGTEQVAA